MKFLFEDRSFAFEALRTAGYAVQGGADLGEVLVTCGRIPDGDEEAWSRQWAALAARVHGIGQAALAAGHRVSARAALLRASNYYRAADFYRRRDPDHDPESTRLAALSRDTFATAAAVLDPPARPVAIPYEGTTLPGYLFCAAGAAAPRPTVIFHAGFDSTLEECYFMVVPGALARGYHVLAFDGPGQGTARRLQGLVFRPDWEKVVTPVVDYALTRPEADPSRLVLMGTSFGGYLAARAAAFEHRIAALVLNDGLYDYGSAIVRGLPPAIAEPFAEGRDAEAEQAAASAAQHSAFLRWQFANTVWTFGAATPIDGLRKFQAYTMEGLAGQITCPTLVLDPEDDLFFHGEPQRIYDALRCQKELIAFSAAEGAGEHCEFGAMLLFEQRVFDRLDELLAPPGHVSTARTG